MISGEMQTLDTLSIIVPVYNEKTTLLKVINSLNNLKISGVEKEIIVVDDSSTDGSTELIKKISGVKKVFHKENKGKGAAIRSALQHVTGSSIIIQDADLEYNPKDILRLWAAYKESEGAVVYGSRFLGKNTGKKILLHDIGNKLLTLSSNLLYGARITDMETCYKLIPKYIFDNISLESNRFDFEPEITAKILSKGIQIIEVPIIFHARGFDEGKKITINDGIRALHYLIKYRIKTLINPPK